ncbi:hypothetical protein GCM10008014_08580 [Paenibacillus silvae]|uniref:ASCH domain-containing protein n=1 Tax=Paenibacillus silvae TaxID=1325358 RepID=A0ABQ1Z3S5_9BACL|nr:ASCH domain-containing protein [Paenibacillus silvae]GGH46122.1 hypothetical protein GCM10008014_08580 [Paenibacillus silvae]
MKAITIHQPWATLIAIGAKRFETRGWKTHYRGPIAIHAAKKDPHEVIVSLDLDIQKAIFAAFYDHFGIQAGALDLMPTGVVVATAELTNCYQSVDTWTDGYELEGKRLIWSPECDFGDFTPGRYAWELSDVKRLEEPIVAKGQQGLWNWDETNKIVG